MSRADRRRRERRAEATSAAGRRFRTAGMWIGKVLLSSLALVLVLYLLALSINGIARWNTRRLAEREPDPAAVAEDNLLVIGVTDDQVTGFLALRVEESENRIFGIAIPDAAFMEVPGQGFERAGDSFKDGPEVSAATISNFLSVTFNRYVVVSGAAYQAALQGQSLVGLLDTVYETNLESVEVDRFASSFESVASESVALVPLPVKPISLGDETFFEPQRDEVADLLLSWWDVSMGNEKDVIRVIVYNGSGEPGVAGIAAQELIRQGFRVVETRNAEDFDHEETLIILYHGEVVDAERVRDALGVGVVSRQEASQQIADVIVIIGKDYSPSSQDG